MSAPNGGSPPCRTGRERTRSARDRSAGPARRGRSGRGVSWRWRRPGRRRRAALAGAPGGAGPDRSPRRRRSPPRRPTASVPSRRCHPARARRRPAVDDAARDPSTRSSRSTFTPRRRGSSRPSPWTSGRRSSGAKSSPRSTPRSFSRTSTRRRASLEQAKAQVEQTASRVATAEAEREADDRLRGSGGVRHRAAGREALAHREAVRADQGSFTSATPWTASSWTSSNRTWRRPGRASARGTRPIADGPRPGVAAEAKVRQAKADVAEARAAVRVAEARLERAKVLAGYTRITAPFDGVVTRRNFHPGAFIRSAADGTPGTAPDGDADRPDAGRDPGARPRRPAARRRRQGHARGGCLERAGDSRGVVARLGKSEDPTTRTMRAEVDLPNPDGLLVEGMYGRATIELQPPTENLTVPAACVIGHSSAASLGVRRA